MRPDSPTPQDHGLGVGGSVVGVAGGAGSDIGGSIAAGQFAGFAADGVAPEAGAVGALYLHDIAVTPAAKTLSWSLVCMRLTSRRSWRFSSSRTKMRAIPERLMPSSWLRR